jgi:hypothetical protein
MIIRSREKTWRSAAAQRILKLAGDSGTVKDAVARIAEGYLSGTSCPPTDLDSIGAKLGITGFEVADLAGSGEIRRDGERFRIFYSNYLSVERRRFTIAHEMGHAILEKAGPNLLQRGKEVERLCDMFAVELLMPKRVFLDCASGEISTYRILEMARHFRTSVATTGMRYAELFSVTVFAVENSKVIWSKGNFRPRPEDPIDDSFGVSIRKALEGESSSEEIFLRSDTSFQRWRLECSPFARGKSVLCLLQPVGRNS